MKKSIFRIIYQLLRFQNYIPSSSVVRIDPSARVYGSRLDGEITIKEGVKIARSELYGKITIGRYSALNGPGLDLYASSGQIVIGNFCSIARNASFQVANHKTNRLSTYQIHKNIFNESAKEDEDIRGDITIGHDVWVGMNVAILSGVNIGNGAVVAANSVVNADVPPYAIVGGVPAKVIRYRFDETIIRKTEDLEWWDWSLEKIKENKDIFGKELASNTQLDVK